MRPYSLPTALIRGLMEREGSSMASDSTSSDTRMLSRGVVGVPGVAVERAYPCDARGEPAADALGVPRDGGSMGPALASNASAMTGFGRTRDFRALKPRSRAERARATASAGAGGARVAPLGAGGTGTSCA